ncbi:glycosyltransferase [Afifella marina]|uniref:Glycosyltransferase involved in cell wall bisynthesis n=1 Tax=Afifella marina DSM 2698 TaxID=1120955 RepID=A0A1G5NBC4_AFIMA|nr:glycosyltransferase [Afifella marina]MBK1623213.1 hypothetical protein [Afifella marina DSM 2698]MBK1626207.1 hypothetical protein [Afifella marina]MBK5917085.1 hypothetical protein [Afifella marina]RAI22076.1 hypothetical protein CH311_05030 [Afifella marina DSM 2698]SCZ34696.1 Glycosyltransferase involved in cell wall bisynthesis [Afifella marina DSM 2698]
MSEFTACEGLGVAVLLPCRDQATTIESVVRGFRGALPDARIYVFDENSSDDTARQARKAGARVLRGPSHAPNHAPNQAVWRMFADIDADIYLLAAGDGSCDPADASSLINALLTERVDMVVGTSAALGGCGADEMRHGGGVFDLYRRFFGTGFSARTSIYRALSRRFVKSFPPVSEGLSPQTELSLHASELMVPVASLSLDGGQSASERKPAENVRHAMGEVATFLRVMQIARPLPLFGVAGLLLGLLGLLTALPALADGDSVQAGAVLSASAFVLAGISLSCGLILESLRRSRLEQKRILFLSVPALPIQ